MPSKRDRTRRFLMAAYLGLGFAVLGRIGRAGAEPGGVRGSTLPFTLTVTPEKLEPLPDYMGPKNPCDMDFPYCPVMIDGEYWIIYKNGYNKPVFRFKGTNIENATRQPDGSANFPLRAPYILGGVWYDEAEKRLYAPMHCEQEGYADMVLREIHLASSTDKGLTWKYEGRLLTRDDPGQPARSGPAFSGLSWDGGDGDHILYADQRGGYIYLFTNHYLWPKTQAPAGGLLRHRVARCAIRDKMAPGKWWKFYNGQWSQPGVGGKASYVNGYCVIYNTYLKKYVSFNYIGGLSVCSDLGKQDWSPSFYAGRNWCAELYGTWPTDQGKTNIFSGDKTLYVYSFWQKAPGRRFRIDLGSGETPVVRGFASPSVYLASPTSGLWAVTMDPAQYYAYTPFFESADTIESRHARRVPAATAETSYSGQWTDDRDPSYYESLARVSATAGASVRFTFPGPDIYWRTVKGPDCGKADVFLDGVLQQTVDCYANLPIPYQFGFIKTGLAPDAPHTIQVVVRGEKNGLSKGTVVRHMLFEYGAETYRASDGFSSVQGKNQWRNQQRNRSAYTDMTFSDPRWRGTGKCEVGYFQMTPDDGDAVRTWVAPHAGTIRIEGKVSIANHGGEEINVAILHGADEIWPTHTMKEKPLAHDLTASVVAGQSLCFIVSKNAAAGGSAVWDPVVTYVRGEVSK